MHRRVDPIYSRLLPLLSRGLYGPSSDEGIPACSLLGEEQWRSILREAEKQTVSGIVFNAVTSLPEGQLPPLPVLTRWLVKAHRISRANSSMAQVLGRQFALFEEHGLHPLLQKGHAAARFYPVPELRACGDIDLWFPGGERVEADRLVASRGHKVVTTPDRGSCYMIGTTEAEHHSMLIEIHNPFHSRYLRELVERNPGRRVTLPGGVSVVVPAPVVELLMINAHILKHCLGVGIGLRQFCDYALAWRALTAPGPDGTAAQVDAGEYFAICRRVGIWRWTKALHTFVNLYLPDGAAPAVTPLGDGRGDDAAARIFAMVCEGGNFGRFNPRRRPTSDMGLWQRKLSTMGAFLNNRSFVGRLVPSETFWTFTGLLAGQIH